MVREAITFMAKSSNRFRRPASQVGNRGFKSPFRHHYMGIGLWELSGKQGPPKIGSIPIVSTKGMVVKPNCGK